MIAANGSAPMNWDDVRVFLAVARNGSLRAAGRAKEHKVGAGRVHLDTLDLR